MCDPEELTVVAAISDGVLGGFRFTEGNRYADFVPAATAWPRWGWRR